MHFEEEKEEVVVDKKDKKVKKEKEKKKKHVSMGACQEWRTPFNKAKTNRSRRACGPVPTLRTAFVGLVPVVAQTRWRYPKWTGRRRARRA